MSVLNLEGVPFWVLMVVFFTSHDVLRFRSLGRASGGMDRTINEALVIGGGGVQLSGGVFCDGGFNLV